MRIDPFVAAPETMTAMHPLEAELLNVDFDRNLTELVRLRASQLNACTYSIHLHARVALLRGETPARLHALQCWQQSALFTARERAALAWTDAVTALNGGHVSNAVYEETLRHFSAYELSALTLLIVDINAWNRIAIGLRLEHSVRLVPPGDSGA
jgi:AhpD family alkylhydroperoxidase